MRALIASCGGRVVDHGRVGQPELLRAKATAQILYYVGDWPEIDCIAVREAAMLGCVPLTSSVAVFSDPSKDYVLRVDGDPTEPSTQRAAAARAAEILLEWKARGALRPSTRPCCAPRHGRPSRGAGSTSWRQTCPHEQVMTLM